jgi:Helicase conserved C-terminal domain
MVKTERPKVFVKPSGFKEVKELIVQGNSLMFDVNISPKSWVLPNRARFNHWIDSTFKYEEPSVSVEEEKPKRKGALTKTQEDSCNTKSESVELFSHQKFIKDYVQYTSPYRGLMVFHGLGTGKTCSAVAAAEIMLKNMNVTVLLPASLKPNFVDEIKKCGSMFYKLKQEWVFIPVSSFKGYESEVAELMSLEKKFVVKQEGVWVPVGKRSNFMSLSPQSQNNIILQLDNMINKRFKFISYNGLTRKAVEEMTEGGVNPFDNRCVIVDEVHNFISKIVNGRAIGQAMYKLLMSAKNCKFVCLSGTPIINYPHEISYLINLLTGPKKTFTLKASPATKFNVDEIVSVLENNSYVDYYNIDENARSISLVFVPDGFKITDRKTENITRDEKHLLQPEMLEVVISELKKIKVDMNKPSKSAIVVDKMLPEDQDEFNRYFINFATNTVNNPKLFMKRVIGAVSYYSTYSPELYPSVQTVEVSLPMNDFQFPIYEKARAIEHKKELQSKTKSNDSDNPFTNSGQVYRFYSRAICNFVFPEEIKRPFPSKTSIASSTELDILEDDAKEVISAIKESQVKSSSKSGQEKDEYVRELNKALDALSQNMYDKSSYLNEENIGKYSPKFKAIWDKIKLLNGNALVYSQFRKVEGLGILGLVMKANGYAEFKVKKNSSGEWDIDIPKEDYNKPKFAMFTGNNDESKMLLKIFNSDFDTLPENIKNKLPELTSKTEKTLNNLHGSLIKVIMITQSGAEGISLKNVRQVHIVEPYWNNVRTSQVIGRAVRTCSHVQLPPNERNVEVFTYCTSFTPELLEKSFTLKTKDKGFTTDEYIYNIAKRKSTIIDSILDLLRKASVDCGINAKKHKNMKCFSFPANMDENTIIHNNNIRDDMLDYQYETDIIDNEWKGQLLKTKKGNFIVNLETNYVYDYDHYIDSKKLVIIGQLKKEDGKYVITKVIEKPTVSRRKVNII